MAKQNLSPNYNVTKSNKLIEAKYKLSQNEQKIILMLSSLIQPNDKDFKSYTFMAKDIFKFLGIASENNHDDLRKILTKLVEKSIYIKKDKGYIVLSWLSSVESFYDKGTIKLCFDPTLKPYLLHLKNRFTTYKLDNIIKLDSIYAIRLYELLKQYEKLKERLFKVEDLRYILGLTNDEYKNYFDFKKNIILVAQKELKNKSDIYFEFEDIKSGKSIIEIKFIIFKNESYVYEDIDIPKLLDENMVNNEIQGLEYKREVEQVFVELDNSKYEHKKSKEKELDIHEIIDILPEKERKNSLLKDLRTWSKEKGFNYVIRNVKYANKNIKNIKDYGSYLFHALINDYGIKIEEEENIQKEIEKSKKIEKEEQLKLEENKKKNNELLIEFNRYVRNKCDEILNSLEQQERIEIEDKIKKNSKFGGDFNYYAKLEQEIRYRYANLILNSDEYFEKQGKK
jgi:plasmid replication initiation protein